MKPSYSTSKAHLFASAMCAWIVILALTAGAIYGSAQAVSFGTFAVPSMAAMIAGMLGVHRHYGSKDFKASQSDVLPPDPPYNSRDDPAGGAS